MKTEPSERIKNLITEYIFKDDYWGYLFSRINRARDTTLSCPMGVGAEIDGSIILLYNPQFIDLMDDDFLKIAIEHEGTHLLNNHIPRLLRIISDEVNLEQKSKKIKRWNLASDCAVNSIIKINKTYTLGTTQVRIIHPDMYKLPLKKTADFYNQNIPDDKEEEGKNQQNEVCNIDDHDSWQKNISKVSDIGSLASRLEQYTEQALEESYNNVRNKGNIPSYITDKINELLNPPQLPYYDIIKKLVKGSRLSKQKRAYTRINKKRIYSFFIKDKNVPIISPFPGKTKDYSFNISIVLDTSGSMNIKDIMEGLSGIKNIIENDKDCLTTVLESDAKIQKEYKVKKIKDIQFDIKGRGGTILLPALIRCRELNTDVTLVFTDGYCDDLNQENRMLLPKKIIYVLTNNGISKNIDRTGYIVRIPK